MEMDYKIAYSLYYFMQISGKENLFQRVLFTFDTYNIWKDTLG